ncbi:MAG: CHAP domain-containing protein [Chitinivibrionales bacterium]|nr:CHAP domain-containing protein [Chitinivibrionales bacterium]MBD3356875.1 CHAP domain-containing protein [Chitinivibrionales bacterium]
MAKAGAIELHGTIVNQSAVPVEGLVVSLPLVNLVDTTDSSGRFLLKRNDAAVAVSALSEGNATGVNSGKVSVAVEDERRPVTLTLYKPNGRRVKRMVEGVRQKGTHALHLQIPEQKAAGGFFGLLKPGKHSSVVRVVNRGSHTIAAEVRETAQSQSTVPADRAVLHKATSGRGTCAADSLIIVHRASDSHSVAIPSLSDDVTVELDLVPHKIIELATAEKGRCPAEVGKDLGQYPGELRNYLRKTGARACDYEAWCSEFVSWVYKAAGMPFTGGDEGGWMYTYSMAIRNWFSRHERFVARTDPDYDTFTPAPGDYIRYKNDVGGHSAIVWKVEGTTLYTIEGNIGNRVVPKTIRNYKKRTDIDGFGMRSGVRGTRVALKHRRGGETILISSPVDP